MIDTKDLTVVLHGAIPPQNTREYAEFVYALKATRTALPWAAIILSAWEGTKTEAAWPVDAIVLSPDPGPLPSFKKNTPHVLNNVNRQLVSAAAGLALVRTRYAMKLRNDFFLSSTRFLHVYEQFGKTVDGNERILAPSLFTVDPRLFEQMPFHLSDWFQLGPTSRMTAMWSAPLVTLDDATYYDVHPAAQHSTYFDRRYRSRFAIEQHTAIHFARQLGYETPAFHNDVRAEVIEAHDRFVAREWLIANPGQVGLVFPKYAWATSSSFQRLNCLTFLDWLNLQEPSGDLAEYKDAARRRAILKRDARRAHAVFANAMPLINAKPVKRVLRPVVRAWARVGELDSENVY